MISAHSIEASLTTRGQMIPLNVTEATLTIDETWSPQVKATLTCTIPANVDLIDPRDRTTRVRGTLTRRFGEAQPIAALSATYSGKRLSDMARPTLASFSADYGLPFNVGGMRSSTRREFDLGLRSRLVDHSTGTMTLRLASDEARLQDYRLLESSPVAVGTSLDLSSGQVDELVGVGAGIWS